MTYALTFLDLFKDMIRIARIHIPRGTIIYPCMRDHVQDDRLFRRRIARLHVGCWCYSYMGLVLV